MRIAQYKPYQPPGVPRGRKRTRMVAIVAAMILVVVVAAIFLPGILSPPPSYVRVSGVVSSTNPTWIPADLRIYANGPKTVTIGGFGVQCGNAPCPNNELEITLVEPFSCPPCHPFSSSGTYSYSVSLPNGEYYQFAADYVDSNGNPVGSCVPQNVNLEPEVGSGSITFNLVC